MYKKRFLLQLMLIVVAGFLAARFLTAILTVMAHLGKRFSLRDIMIPSVVTGNTTQTVIAPFDPKRPVTVVILTYQRCGSSFFGQLFNTNPDVFYMYEPLDSLYSALYGTKEGWNVPSDITTYANGTERIIPRSEEHAVAQFLGHILSCDVDSLPTETLVHRFLYIFSNFQVVLREFIRCLSRNKLKYTRCDSFTSSVCGKRFGEHTDDIHEKCNKFLWNEELRRTEIGELAKKTRQYRNCLDGMRSVLDRECAALFRTKCSESNLRAVKTVRATMASMEYLLEKDVNLRVIHLIRDPRAVVLSRMNFDVSTRSLYAQNDLIKEAEVYCRDVVRDVRRRRLLEIKYPGRLMTVLYDELTKRPIFYAKEIYAFLNATLPRETIHWLEKNTNDIKNSTRIAKKWQWKLTYETAKHIRETCKTFFTEIQYDFP